MAITSGIITILICAFSFADSIAATGSPLKSPDSSSDIITGLNSTILREINKFRLIHDTPALVWNESLAENAHAVAKVACPLKQSRDDAGVRSMIVECHKGINATDYLVQSPLYIDNWYMDCQNYHTANHTGGAAFTKLIWNATTDVGCSWSPGLYEAVDTSQRSKVSKFVCLFYPPAVDDAEGHNATEEYKRNVKFPELCPRGY